MANSQKMAQTTFRMLELIDGTILSLHFCNAGYLLPFQAAADSAKRADHRANPSILLPTVCYKRRYILHSRHRGCHSYRDVDSIGLHCLSVAHCQADYLHRNIFHRSNTFHPTFHWLVHTADFYLL
jgi:hypothetical protein